jgi:hypothetical protein
MGGKLDMLIIAEIHDILECIWQFEELLEW